MIKKDMIKQGLAEGIISLENEYGGCIGLCCKIGDTAFYFAGGEDSSLTVEEYYQTHTMEEIVDILFAVLKDTKTAEQNGLEDFEYLHYITMLDNCSK